MPVLAGASVPAPLIRPLTDALPTHPPDANISSVQNELFKLREDLTDTKRARTDALYQVRPTPCPLALPAACLPLPPRAPGCPPARLLHARCSRAANESPPPSWPARLADAGALLDNVRPQLGLEAEKFRKADEQLVTTTAVRPPLPPPSLPSPSPLAHPPPPSPS